MHPTCSFPKDRHFSLPIAVLWIPLAAFLLFSVHPPDADAQQPTIGVFLDPAGTTNLGAMVSATPLDLYIVGFNPPPTLWAFDFQLFSSTPPDLYLEQDSPFVADPMTADGYFHVLVRTCPAVGDTVLLGHVKVLYFTDQQDLFWCVGPTDGRIAPTWRECIGPEILLAAHPTDPASGVPDGCALFNPSGSEPPPPTAYPFHLELESLMVTYYPAFSQRLSSNTTVRVKKPGQLITGSYDISRVVLHAQWDPTFVTLLGVRQGPTDLNWNLAWEPDSTGVTVTIEAAGDFIPHWNDPLLYFDLQSAGRIGDSTAVVDSVYVEYSDGVEDPASLASATISITLEGATEALSWGTMKSRYSR